MSGRNPHISVEYCARKILSIWLLIMFWTKQSVKQIELHWHSYTATATLHLYHVHTYIKSLKRFLLVGGRCNYPPVYCSFWSFGHFNRHTHTYYTHTHTHTNTHIYICIYIYIYICKWIKFTRKVIARVGIKTEKYQIGDPRSLLLCAIIRQKHFWQIFSFPFNTHTHTHTHIYI